jgi:NAD(P)H-dependent FMN reductase
LYQRLSDLPHFNPDVELAGLPEPVIDLRAQLGLADAVLFSTPEYAGALPGSFKNLLDWSVGEGLYQKPVGWVNPSPHEGGAERTYEILRVVLGYVNADIVEGACVRAPVRRDAVGDDGLIHDAAARGAIRSAVQALVAHALGKAQ